MVGTASIVDPLRSEGILSSEPAPVLQLVCNPRQQEDQIVRKPKGSIPGVLDCNLLRSCWIGEDVGRRNTGIAATSGATASAGLLPWAGASVARHP